MSACPDMLDGQRNLHWRMAIAREPALKPHAQFWARALYRRWCALSQAISGVRQAISHSWGNEPQKRIGVPLVECLNVCVYGRSFGDSERQLSA